MIKFVTTQMLRILLLIGVASGANAGLIGIGGSSIQPDDVMSLFSIDTNTGASTLIGSTGIGGLQGLAVNPLTGDIYTTGGSDAGPSAGLYRINPLTGAATYVAGTGHFVALDFASDGTLYGVGALGDTSDGVADELYTIDLITGAVTLVRNLGGFAGAGIAFSQDGTELVYTWGGTQVTVFDTTTWGVDFTGPVASVGVKRIATAPDGTIYGTSFPGSSTGTNLWTLDLGPPARGTVVGGTGFFYQGLAFGEVGSPPPPGPVPEPGILALFLIGLLGLGISRRRAYKKSI